MYMKKIAAIYEKWKWPFFFFAGLFAAFFSCVAYWVIGTRSYVQIHDQLDGEVLNYIYGAKYLFTNTDVIPELMNGMHASAMTPPAPLGLIFYKMFAPFWAYASMHLFSVVVGYVGFFLLAKKMTEHPIISFVTACIFVYLPFYPVYGLSVLGQPLLVWALWQLYDKKPHKYIYLFCVFLYAAGSSFALVGYAWIAVLFIALIVLLVRHKPVKEMTVAFLLLLGTYLACNIQLLGAFLGIGGASYPLHREEMVVVARADVRDYFFELFLDGANYAQSYNTIIAIMALGVLLLYPIGNVVVKKSKYSKNYFALLGLFGCSVVLALLAALWKAPVVVDIRVALGGVFKYFQADRISWLLPLCWYMILALCLHIICVEWKKLWGVRYLVSLVCILLLCNVVYENSTIYHNLRLMIFPDTYDLMDWDEFYAEDVYEQVEEYIGKDKSTYRTVSLGITPAAALYNGFYCLDGYSNMYSLEYKHEFRETMAKELDKLEELRVYFDTWGNRCYLFNAETGNYMLIDKHNGASYENLELDTAKLYEMGARYLFSAMPINHAEEMGLELMRETPFSTPESYFEVWLYEIVNR